MSFSIRGRMGSSRGIRWSLVIRRPFSSRVLIVELVFTPEGRLKASVIMFHHVDCTYTYTNCTRFITGTLLRVSVLLAIGVSSVLVGDTTSSENWRQLVWQHSLEWWLVLLLRRGKWKLPLDLINNWYNFKNEPNNTGHIPHKYLENF